MVPSGDNATAVAWYGCVLSVLSKVPLVDHILTVLSSLADTMKVPSAEQAKPVTRAEWPPRIHNGLAVKGVVPAKNNINAVPSRRRRAFLERE
jgi:hypothetical protein